MFFLILVGMFAAEARFLRGSYGEVPEKRYEGDYPYTPTNGSHMQLTNGRSRRPQSEL